MAMLRKKWFLVLSFVMLSAVATTACESQLDDKPSATVTDPAKKDDAAAKKDDMAAKKDDMAAKKDDMAAKKDDMAAMTTLKVDLAASKVGFVGAKVTGDHEGSFKEFDGTATVKGDKMESVAFTVKTASVVSDAEKLTGHLKSPDFFNVEKFPEASFKSTKIEEKAAGTNTHQVTGDLTMLGITKTITFPATIKKDGDKWVGASEFKIMRFDWGIKYPGKADDLIKDEVLMKLNLVFPAKKA
jgi:polyisoprenoid-binding protein YceI